MKKKKILHGLTEVAGQAWYSVLGLRKANEDVKLVTWMKSHFDYPVDYVLNIDKNRKKLIPMYMVKMLFFFGQSIIKYNVFHFHFGKSMLYNYDLSILKILRKKIIYEYHGSEIRNPSIKYSETRNDFFYRDELSEIYAKNNKKICKYADKIIFHDDELISHLPPYKGEVYVVPLRMDLEKFDPVYPSEEQKVITILHAPSKRAIKGTEHVLDTVEKLKTNYNIELILVENTSQEEARKLYQQADIIIDQIVIGTYGVFAIEGMALGKPVITYIDEFMKTKLPSELPIVSADEKSLYAELKILIENPSLRRKIGMKGRNYVEAYHDYRHVGEMLSQIYNNKLEPVRGKEAFEVVKKIKIKSNKVDNQ